MRKPNQIIKGLTVEVKNDRFDHALRKFRRAVDDDGKIKEVFERRYYTKPSEKRKIARKRAVKRWERKLKQND